MTDAEKKPYQIDVAERVELDFDDSIRAVIGDIVERSNSDGDTIALLTIEYAAVRTQNKKLREQYLKALQDVTNHNQAQYENIKQLFRLVISHYDYHYDEEEKRFVPDRWDSAQQRVALLNAIDPLAYKAVYTEKNKKWIEERNEALKAQAEKQKAVAEKALAEKGQADENTTSPKE